MESAGAGGRTAAVDPDRRDPAAERLRDLGLQQQAVARGHLLRRLLATVVDRPDDPIMVVGCPPDDVLPLLWGLHHLAAEMSTTRQYWTFSTYETRSLDAAGAPRIVFLPDRPHQYTARTMVDLRPAGAVRITGQETAERVDRAVDTFVHNGGSNSDDPAVAIVRSDLPRALRTRPVGARGPASAGAPTSHGEQSALVERLLVATDAVGLRLVLDRLWQRPREEIRKDLGPGHLIEVYEHLASLTGEDEHDMAAGDVLTAVLGPHCVDVGSTSGLAYARTVVALPSADVASGPRARPLVRRLMKEGGGALSGAGGPVAAPFASAGRRATLGGDRPRPPGGVRAAPRDGGAAEPRAEGSRPWVVVALGLVVLLLLVATLTFAIGRLFSVETPAAGPTTTTAITTEPAGPVSLPDAVSVSAQDVPSGQVAYIVYRDQGNNLYVGPTCTLGLEGDRLRCERGELPAEFTSGVLQVVASTPEVRDAYLGRRISRAEWSPDQGFPEGMIRVEDEVEES